MSKVYLLGANTSYDRSEQSVAVKQIVQMEGYDYGRKPNCAKILTFNNL